METLISKMNDNARKTWDKVRKSFHIDNTDEEYKQWRDETIGILEAEGEEGFCDICNMEGFDVNDLETLLFHAFE